MAGNTADPTAFTGAVTAVRERFGLQQMVMVGGRGMITSARIEALRELGGMGWVTALRAPAIAALAADTGPLQMSLFDEVNLAEITHPLCIRAAHGTPTPRWGSGRGRMTRVSTCSRHRGETSGLARLGTMTRWEHDGPPEIRRAVVS